jgi:hypothetical protein
MGWDGMGYNWRRAIFSDGRMGMGGWDGVYTKV